MMSGALSHVVSPHHLDASLPRCESLGEMLSATAGRAPDQTALVCEGRELTYERLARAVTGLASRILALEGEKRPVGMMMPNGIEAVVAAFAAFSSGGQLAPFNPFFTLRELAPVVRGAELACLMCVPSTRGHADALADAIGGLEILEVLPDDIEQWAADADLTMNRLPHVAADDLALLIHTGGSTGVPKGVVHAHASLTQSVLLHASAWPLRFDRERFFSTAPMFHIWGLGYSTLVPVYAGGTMYIVPKYDAEKALRMLAELEITVFGGGPAPIYAGLTLHPLIREQRYPALKYCLTGGAPCPAELHRSWRELTGCALYEGWGMTEGAPLCLNVAGDEQRPGSVGRPVAETELQVVSLEDPSCVLPLGERGELRVRGPQVMVEYRNRPEETAETLRDGWLHTGDVGYVDNDGFVYLVDRKKEMVISGGYNVYPREVEDLLVSHPLIDEAACVGTPDERLGEVIAAFVATRPGSGLDEDAVFEFCRDNLVKYKRPTIVRLLEALPRTATNKIDKLGLKASVRET
jgi:long-chain acyl-CoA synthetase